MSRQERRKAAHDLQTPEAIAQLQALAEDQRQGFPVLKALKAAAEYQPKTHDPLAKAVSR